MKQNSVTVQRQNDKEAISLIKASEHCLETERWLKYIMIFLSFAVCLAAIFNRYLPQMAGHVENIVEIQAKAATYLNLISGAIIIAGLPLGFYTSRMHTEGTVLRDRYEAYVFDNAPNLTILRPISQSFISVYAKKRKKEDGYYENFLYDEDDSVNDATAQFDFINKEVHSDYNMYLALQPFYMTIWLGFCVLILLIALSFNDAFITTLINILIPSLSAITTICSSWYSCRLQMRQLTNLINVIDQIQAMSAEKKKQYITDKKNMRMLADGLFNYRSSSFVIPVFLVRHHQKAVEKAKQDGKIEVPSQSELPKLTVESKQKAPAQAVKKEPAQVVKKEVAATTSQPAAKKETPAPSVKKETAPTPAKKEPAPQPAKKEAVSAAAPVKKETAATASAAPVKKEAPAKKESAPVKTVNLSSKKPTGKTPTKK